MNRLLVIVLLVMAAPCLAIGQAPSAQPPKPGPEVQRLGHFVGTWNTVAGKSTSTMSCEWFAGGYSVVCREEASGAQGKFSGLRVLTYDPGAKVYTHYMITSMGPGGGLSKGTVTGNTWLWQWEGTDNGKPANYRLTLVEVSPTARSTKVEVSVAGGPWTVIEEGKSVKVK